MAKIVPTILTDDKNFYARQITAYSSFADRIQIDICDGVFTPSKTIELSDIVPQANTPALDLHMMVMNPSQFLPVILALRPSLCIFHAESAENLLPIFSALKQNNIKTGVALLPKTFPGRVKSYLQFADHCLVFAGRLGASGGEADMLQIEKIPIIKNLSPNIEIGWDGGANLKNVRSLARAGVDVINVGSAISNATDPRQAFADLIADLDKPGVVI